MSLKDKCKAAAALNPGWPAKPVADIVSELPRGEAAPETAAGQDWWDQPSLGGFSRRQLATGAGVGAGLAGTAGLLYYLLRNRNRKEAADSAGGYVPEGMMRNTPGSESPTAGAEVVSPQTTTRTVGKGLLSSKAPTGGQPPVESAGSPVPKDTKTAEATSSGHRKLSAVQKLLKETLTKVRNRAE